MAEQILVTHQLTKAYGKTLAVNKANLTLEKGQIYGLVGKNGAGKTTILRMLTGQANSTSGTFELFGAVTEKAKNEARKRTGAMIECPSFFPFLTAKENLEHYRIQRGIAGKECVENALEFVGLSNTGNKKFKQFSLGMKQRLGLALAIMSNPDLLILDEPINGLDPMGIVEFRNTLLKLNHEKNITILISSHILSELSMLATHYGFIEQGVLLEEISAQGLHDKCKACIEIQVDDPQKAVAVLEKDLGCSHYEVLPAGIIHIYEFVETPNRVSNCIIQNGLALYAQQVKGMNLEDYFISLVGGKKND